MDFIFWGKNERRLLMEKIKTALKAVAIFFIMYVIISGNGDDTFFAWIIMGISLVLTKLFLDESKNKFALSGLTLILAFICYKGFTRAIILFVCCGLLLCLYYFIGCKGEQERFFESISRIFKATPKKEQTQRKRKLKDKEIWKAWNIFHPIEERYSYDFRYKLLLVKKKFPSWNIGDIEKIPISEFANLNQNLVEKHLIWCTVTIPLKNPRQVKKKAGLLNFLRKDEPPHEPIELVLHNIRIKRWNELEYILKNPIQFNM